MSLQALNQTKTYPPSNIFKPVVKVFLYFIAIAIVFALVSVSTSANLPVERKQLAVPILTKTSVDSTKTSNPPLSISPWKAHHITIKPNGSLSQALDEIRVPLLTAYKIQKIKNSKLITRLNAGDKLTIWVDEHQKLQKIYLAKSDIIHIELTRKGDIFKIEKIKKKVQKIINVVSAEINGSFYLSAQAAGLSAKTIMALSDIFGWEIDFVRQLRKGNPFRVVYEKNYINGEYIGDGDILAAEITTNHRDQHFAFLLKDKKGKKLGYYDEKNRNLRKAFLRSPVDHVRITSRFNPKRFHPVLKRWKSHRGVDYAGAVGTPIRTTADGRITRRGWSKSYGNVVYIKHKNKYMTVYAHMSKFGKYKKGSWVKQGQIIGYIGATGRVTGPHLHYEFRKNGKHIDPLKVKFPDAGPVPRKHRKKFKQYAKLMRTQLDRTALNSQLVSGFE